MMEPFLVKFRGRCSVSNILTEGGLRFDALPKLEAYPEGICWLNTVALCPYSGDCSFVSGHTSHKILSRTRLPIRYVILSNLE
jgi:hypothetical protein